MNYLTKICLLVIAVLALGSTQVLAEDAALRKRIETLERAFQEMNAEKDRRISALEAKLKALTASSPTSLDERLGGPGPEQMRRLANLDSRLADLEVEREKGLLGVPDWVSSLRLSGSAEAYYFNGEANSHAPDSRMAVENVRLFFDFDVADNISFFTEWDMVRESKKKQDFTQMYFQFDKLFGNESINLRAGRMLIPYGEEYLRFHNDRHEKPFITFSAPAGWWWDEGLMLFGALDDGRVEYFLSVMDGDLAFNRNSNEELQFAGKLAFRPTDSLKLSASFLNTGKLGNEDSAGKSAFFFGGDSFLRPFGSSTSVPSYQNGALVAADPNMKVELRSWELDAILSRKDLGHLWLAYGQHEIRSNGSSTYDRDLDYYIIEGKLELGLLSERLSRAYVAARYSKIGSANSGEGYMLGGFNGGGSLGYNTESLDIFSIGLGYRIHDNVTLKAEYAWYNFELVDGVTPALEDSASGRDFFGIGISAKF